MARGKQAIASFTAGRVLALPGEATSVVDTGAGGAGAPLAVATAVGLAAPVLSAGTPGVAGTLAAGTYFFKVASTSAAGESAGSNEVSVVVPSSVLAAPVQSAASTAVTGGTLPAATAFFYKVTARNAAGETLGSNEVTVTTGAGATNTNTVNWTAVPGATSYRVYRGTAAAGESVFYSTGNVVTFADTGAASTAGTVPVTNTAVTAVGSVALAWTSVGAATGYRAYAGTVTNTENRLVAALVEGPVVYAIGQDIPTHVVARLRNASALLAKLWIVPSNAQYPKHKQLVPPKFPTPTDLSPAERKALGGG